VNRLLSTGAAAVVRLDESHDLTAAYREAAPGDVHVELEYLNGPPAEAATPAMVTGARMVRIGSALAPAMACTRKLHDVRVRMSSASPTIMTAEGAAGRIHKTLPCRGCRRSHHTGSHSSLGKLDEAWQAQCAGSANRFVLRP